MLARIETLVGVRGAWTDRRGERIVVALSGRVPRAVVAAAVTTALAPREVEPVPAAEAERAARACARREPGWFRGPETRALSNEEAAVVAGRAARGAVARLGLDAERAARLETRVRETLEAVFDAHKGAGLAGLDGRAGAALARVVNELALSEEQSARLRVVLEEAWRDPAD